MKWLHKLEEDFTLDLSKHVDKAKLRELKDEIIENREFVDEKKIIRLIIYKQDESIFLKVLKRYSWDGNSPKFSIFDLFWLGTPEGFITNNKPITYYASLIHDVLGQFKDDDNMPSIFKSKKPDLWRGKGRKGRDCLYLNILKEEDFMLRDIYFWAIRWFGPLYDLYFLYLVKGKKHKDKAKAKRS